MQRLLAHFLIVLMLLPAFYNLGVTAYWLVNRTYIAATLCVKRDEPGNCCQGKCYLTKKITEAPVNPSDKDEKIPTLSLGFELAECVSNPDLPIYVLTPLLWNKASYPFIPDFYAVGFMGSIFHPPPSQAFKTGIV